MSTGTRSPLASGKGYLQQPPRLDPAQGETAGLERDAALTGNLRGAWAAHRNVAPAPEDVDAERPLLLQPIASSGAIGAKRSSGREVRRLL